jgi:hypothetical protein
MTSLAKEGPDRKTAGCLRSSALGTTSLIISPLPTSSPLLTQMIGTCSAEAGQRGGQRGPAAPPAGRHACQQEQRGVGVGVGVGVAAAAAAITLGGSTSRMLCRKARLCCTGTACTA